MTRTLTPEAIAAAEAELIAKPHDETNGLRAKIRARLSAIMPAWITRSSDGKTPAQWCAEFNALRASSRRGFESRGEKVPDCLQDRQPCESLEAEAARAVADTESVRVLIVGIKSETARLHSEAARLRAEFDSSPIGQEILQLRSERRQMISEILQIDAGITRDNRNAKLLLSYCDYYIGSRPPNLPRDGVVSRFSSDFSFLVENCVSAGFELPADATTIESVSRFVISQCPPQPPVPPAPAPNADTDNKTHRIIRARKQRATEPAQNISRRRRDDNAF